ncbi:phage tail tape measure protein [Candidatus Pantoea multigeneris]|uniref:Phage tail tape measure protein n=1 Tax=Candidatus Pantoea multigeneris TaxID=2608357 RepID=A0ABX0R8E9_9GAMM|nr:phage tail tape measure protein [Pantoea multigeneris]NIF20576.1 phage tail tape measure protein [Pantoea multigeneris]
MATLRELIIKISANSSSFQTEIARASRMGQDYYRTMENGGRQAAAAAKESERALSDLTSGFASAGRAAAAAAAAFATGEIIAIADEWTSVNARMRQASSSTEDFAASQRKLMAISQATGTAFVDNANLFSRAAASMREYGYSSDDVLKITEALSTGLKLSGASTEESGSVITQFSQALAQGVLRGEEFNAVNEAGDRVIRALAAGMGVARKDLKGMADQGQLTIDKVVPALINQLGTLQKEFAAMPQTVSGAMQKVSNSFMAWVGNINNATGATQALSGGVTGLAGAIDSFTASAVSGTLNDVANNMSTITTVAGALVGVGLAKYLGGVVSSATGATTSLIAAAKSEVALAAAQEKAAASAVAASRAAVYRAQQGLQAARSAEVQAAQQERVAAADAKVTAAQTRLNAALASGTATEKGRARTALDRAQAALVSAKNADAQAAAERRLAAAQASLNGNLANRVAAQNNLNNVTSVGSRLLGGALGLIGGVPGLVMLGAGAWYAMYQNQEQARESAREYIKTLEQVKSALPKMSLPEVSDNAFQTKASLNEQNRLVDEQARKVSELKSEVQGYQQILSNPGPSIGGFLVNHLISLSDATNGLDKSTSSLAVEQERLYQMQAKSQDVQSALTTLENRRIDLIRQQAAEQNAAYQSLVMMNGQHSEFNRLMSLGNNLIEQRSHLGTYTGPVLDYSGLNQKQQQALQKAERERVLGALDGLEKLHQQRVYEAQDLGLTGVYYNKYISDMDSGAISTQNIADSKKELTKSTNAQNKAEKEAASQAENYARKMADLSVATEVQKVRASEGEKASELYAATHQTGAKWTEEQRKAIRDSSAELAIWTQRAEENIKKQRDQVEALKDLREAARRLKDEGALTVETASLSDRQKQRYDETQQIGRTFDKTDKGTAAIAARNQALDALDKKYQAIAATEGNWLSGVSKGYQNWLDSAGNVAGTVATAITSTMDSALDNMSSMLIGSKADWKSWGLSVLQMLAKVALQMTIVNTLKQSGGSLLGGLIGGITSSIGGVASGAAASTGGVGAMGLSTSFAAYDGGGFTGVGGKYDPAGIVHKGEFVFTKEATQRIGVDNLYGMMRGYADGGAVGGKAQYSSKVNTASNQASPSISVYAPVNLTQPDSGSSNPSGVGAIQKQLSAVIQSKFTDLLKKEMSPGGILYNR